MGNVEIVLDGLRFPEGPAFDDRGALWMVELKGRGLVHWKDQLAQRISTGGAPNGAAIDAHGRVVFCDAEECSLRRHDPLLRKTETLAGSMDGVALNKPNDLAFDAAGNLVFTCPGNSREEPSGYVCVLRRDGHLRKVAEDLYFPNGLAFTADGKELVIAETYRQRLWRGRWDASSATWIAPAVWASGLDGAPGPDGMAFGHDGALYAAVYGSGTVMKIGHTGNIVDRITLPGRNPTNCAFDPSGKLGLVITEAELGLLLSIPALGTGAPLFKGAL